MRNMTGTVIFALGLLFYGCGGGGGGDSSASNDSTSLRVLAKNIVFKSIAGTLAPRAADSSEIDMTTTVLAENVQLETTDNALTSNNLQDALDNEMAINLSQLLPGTTWTITNKTTDSWYSGSTGEVTFSDGTLTVNQGGKFAAAGIITDYSSVISTPCSITTPISYEIINNSMMYITFHEVWYSGSGGIDRSSVIIIAAKNKNTITMMGFGGAGQVGAGRISILTKKE